MSRQVDRSEAEPHKGVGRCLRQRSRLLRKGRRLRQGWLLRDWSVWRLCKGSRRSKRGESPAESLLPVDGLGLPIGHLWPVGIGIDLRLRADLHRLTCDRGEGAQRMVDGEARGSSWLLLLLEHGHGNRGLRLDSPHRHCLLHWYARRSRWHRQLIEERIGRRLQLRRRQSHGYRGGCIIDIVPDLEGAWVGGGRGHDVRRAATKAEHVQKLRRKRRRLYGIRRRSRWCPLRTARSCDGAVKEGVGSTLDVAVVSREEVEQGRFSRNFPDD